jgi:hypothetical protein
MTTRGFKAKPASATPDPEPPAAEGLTPKGPAPETGTTLPDLPPPEPQQAEARAGGEEQVEAPAAAPSEEAAETSRSPGDLLMVRRGYQNIITIDLVDDPMLTDNNIKTFKKAYKELYDFAMVRRDYSSACIRC